MEGHTGSDNAVQSLKEESRRISKETESSSHTTPHWHVSRQKLHLKGKLDSMCEHTSHSQTNPQLTLIYQFPIDLIKQKKELEVRLDKMLLLNINKKKKVNDND